MAPPGHRLGEVAMTKVFLSPMLILAMLAMFALAVNRLVRQRRLRSTTSVVVSTGDVPAGAPDLNIIKLYIAHYSAMLKLNIDDAERSIVERSLAEAEEVLEAVGKKQQ
jgi:hypothetical protein